MLITEDTEIEFQYEPCIHFRTFVMIPQVRRLAEWGVATGEEVNISLQKHLGYFNHTSRLSQLRMTKECYQIGFLESSQMSFFFGYIS